MLSLFLHGKIGKQKYLALFEITELKVGNLLGVWRIEESEQELMDQLFLDQGEINFLNSVKFAERRIQWLASRVLIRTMVKPPGQILMDWNRFGQPIVLNYDFHVSISHCKEMAAAIVSDRQSGVDIERKSDKVERIAQKFVREDEFVFVQDLQRTEYLLVFWAAKEALFKLKGGGGIDFKQHLQVLPFSMQEHGQFHLNFLKGAPECFRVSYKWIDEHILLWIF